MKNTEFVNRVLEIAASNPTYRTGGNGSDGTCDCIGLIMGALGGKWDIHSSNYFARIQMRSLDALLDEGQLHPGSIVYKSRRDRGDLNERYKAGGRYYNGDLLDYYHVGVVTGVDPLEITHCTSTANVNGIAYDDNIRDWSHYGDLLMVDYAEADDAEPETPASVDLAVVYSESGEPVRMRSKPTTDGSYNTIVKVPFGAQVEVVESDGIWSTVRWDGKRGYMQNQYLRLIGMAQADPEQTGTVTISINKNAAAELLQALSGVL